MSLRLSSLLPLVLLAAPLQASASDRLIVAGDDGILAQARTDVGEFELFAGACTGPIRTMTADLDRVYTLDDFGQITIYERENGNFHGTFTLEIGDVSALAASGGFLFAGTEEGLVARVDPRTGDVLDSRTTPSGVRALLAHGRFLFAATSDGAVYRAPRGQGEFSYFTCFCFFQIQGMAMVGPDLFIVDSNGTTVRADGKTGQLLSAFWVGPTNSIAASNGTLFFYYAGGAIPRFRAETGQMLSESFTSPIDVRTMLVLRDPPGLAKR